MSPTLPPVGAHRYSACSRLMSLVQHVIFSERQSARGTIETNADVNNIRASKIGDACHPCDSLIHDQSCSKYGKCPFFGTSNSNRGCGVD
jgi:RNA polymerase sigma-70 factor, ECF subfamily